MNASTNKIVLPLLALFLIVSSSAATAGDQVDRMLGKQAGKLSDHLHRVGIESVAVLPFRLKSAEEGYSLSNAQIQQLFARKLERALVLADSPKTPVKVVFDAWKQLTDANPDSTFATSKGRNLIFNTSLALPVDAPKTTIEALISGTIVPSDDYRTTTVEFAICKRDNPGSWTSLKDLSVTFPTDATSLTQMGRGFSVPRSLAKTRSVLEDSFFNCIAEEQTLASKQDSQQSVNLPVDRIGKPQTDPISMDQQWVKLGVLYDEQKQTLFRDSLGGRHNHTMRDPSAGQVVTFQLENISDQTVSVLLTVNGQNTLYGRRVVGPEGAAKWVLAPHKIYRVRGIYAKDRKSFTPITGVSDSKSAQVIEQAQDENGNADQMIGMIQMAVFVQQTGNESGSDIRPPNKIAGLGNGESQISGGGPSPLPPGKGAGNVTIPTPPKKNIFPSSIDADDADNTGFKMSYVRGITVRRADDWRSLQKKITEAAGGKPKPRTRGLMLAGGESKKADVKKTEFEGSEIRQYEQIRYFSITPAGTHLSGGNVSQP